MRKGQRGPERSAMDLAAVHKTTQAWSPRTHRARHCCSVSPRCCGGPPESRPFSTPSSRSRAGTAPMSAKTPRETAVNGGPMCSRITAM